MRHQWYAALIALAHALAHGSVQDGGGRDISVALFTTGNVLSVVVEPTAPGAWTASCGACTHKPLTAPIVLSRGELYAGGTLRVEDAANRADGKTASGLWHLRSGMHGVDVVLTLPSERYTAAVLNAETAANEPEESLRALAIVARTYALNGRHYNAGPGHLAADLCDSTQCQALRLGAASGAINEAVRATAGETLWFGRARAEVFFSQHCGGQTADVTEAWTAGVSRPVEPYLRSHADRFCLRNGPANWHASLSIADLATVAQREGWRLPVHISAVSVLRRSGSGRVLQLSVRGIGGETHTLSASALRFGVGRAFGWNRIRSDLYDIALHDDVLVFDGRGHGHGVGLCQAGATEMAVEHHDARSILAFYFPGTNLRITPTDDGWRETRTEGVRVRSSGALSSETRDALTRAWRDAMQRFPVARPPEPIVLIAPSTEMYRQMTGQPGWQLGNTRGNVVTLQPEQVLRKHRADSGDEEATLRHELLHVLIENEATDQAPLWLREGLAEALSATALSVASANATGADMDARLQHAETASAASAAHTFAGTRVHALIARYGLPAVRGWLRSGVPASVAAGK